MEEAEIFHTVTACHRGRREDTISSLAGEKPAGALYENRVILSLWEIQKIAMPNSVDY